MKLNPHMGIVDYDVCVYMDWLVYLLIYSHDDRFIFIQDIH